MGVSRAGGRDDGGGIDGDVEFKDGGGGGDGECFVLVPPVGGFGE